MHHSHLCVLRRTSFVYLHLFLLYYFLPDTRWVLQAGKGAERGGAGANAGVGLWEELQPGRDAWLETGPCMGRGRLPAVMSDEGLSLAVLWRTESVNIDKVRLSYSL